jgi:hypothetical protein
MIRNNRSEITFQLCKAARSTRRSSSFFFCSRFFVQQCADIFGPQFTGQLLDRGIDFTNGFYGSDQYQGSRVLFVNGAIDPWHALSFTKDPPNNNTAIFLSSKTNQSEKRRLSNEEVPFV